MILLFHDLTKECLSAKGFMFLAGSRDDFSSFGDASIYKFELMLGLDEYIYGDNSLNKYSLWQLLPFVLDVDEAVHLFV